MANATLDPMTTTNPITPESLTSPKALQTVTATADKTNFTGITDSATQSVADSYTTANDLYNNASKNLTDTGTGVLDIMKSLQGKTADTQNANEFAGVNTATADVNKYVTQLSELNAEASSLKREASAIPLQTQEKNLGTGATDRGVAPQDTSALRNNAIKALSIAQQSDITSAALTGSQVRLKAAEDKAKQIIDLKYKPIEDELALKQKQYDLNKDTLSLIDKKRTEALGIALEKEKAATAEKKAIESQISSLQLEAAKNGASPEIQAAIMGSKNIGEAIKAAGASLATPNTEIVKVGDNSAFLIDKKTGKILKSYAGSTSGGGSGLVIPAGAPPTVTALASLVGLVPNFPSVNAQKVFTASVNDLAKKPNNERAIAEKIMGQTIDNIKDETTRKIVTGNLNTAKQITRVQGLFDDYVAKGGETGWLKGATEDTYQFVGKTTDPELAGLGAEIANSLDELVRYRTGAALSPAEEKFFDKILAGKGKSPELNTALTSALKRSMMATVENSLQNSLTSDGVTIIKSATPDLFGDYRSANPTIQLKAVYTSSPTNKATIDKIRAEHPEWGATEIMQIFNGQ